jgi:hypothetical protein
MHFNKSCEHCEENGLSLPRSQRFFEDMLKKIIRDDR